MKKFLLSLAAVAMAASASAEVIVDKIQTFEGMDKFPFFVMGYEPEIIDGILTVPEYPGGWYQFFVMDGLTFDKECEYTVTAKIKGSKNGSLNVQLGNWGALQEGQLSFTSEWAEQSATFVGLQVEEGFSVFQPGTYDGSLEIEWIKLSHETGVEVEWSSIITGGVAADGQSHSFLAGPGAEAPVVDNPDGEGVVYETPIVADPENPWDSQFFIVFNEALEAGTRIRVSFDYFCTDARTIDTQAHGNPGAYHHYAFIGSMNAKPEWQQHFWDGKISAAQAGEDGCKSIAFNLSTAPEAATFYINNIVVEKATVIQTGIAETVAAQNGRTVVYNLMGVKVLDTDDASQISTLKKGIYIINGKKVIL